MSRFLMVELEQDLVSLRTTHDDVFLQLQAVDGVRSVVDLSGISRETLDDWLLPSPGKRRPRKVAT